ncbi:hypothetical protein [Leptolyngbya sp. 7M]|uniref:hypothetical protein n=1 Tax=Leptolyngbya sp. 7M TaxID=2812896 RepID=UPI001B8CD584|nr:hypothetical protein [Leptolyngbya sp. 7M]QYO65056.1 hypothetical protein JVX88_37050 [Leptolyngbya sp. 7M]
MFKVITRNYSAEFERWTDALDAANALKPECKNWLQDIRIFDGDDLVWIYSRLHRYPQYIGAGTYNRLARLFIFEAMLEEELKQAAKQETQENQNQDNQMS